MQRIVTGVSCVPSRPVSLGKQPVSVVGREHPPFNHHNERLGVYILRPVSTTERTTRGEKDGLPGIGLQTLASVAQDSAILPSPLCIPPRFMLSAVVLGRTEQICVQSASGGLHGKTVGARLFMHG
jgi:hypothetical protein